MVVIVSHPQDLHAARVISALQTSGVEVVLLDLTELPDRASITVDYSSGGPPRIAWTRRDAAPIDLLRATSVWWRRPQAPDLTSMTHPDVLAFAFNEWQEALNGLWQLVPAPWMNPPAADELASRKALQLKVAAEVELRTPRTLITSDPEEARQFVKERAGSRTAFKTFSCTHAIWRETRLVGEPELALMDQVRLAPVIFQEYLAGGADVRVTVVGRRTFAAAIDATTTDYPVDFRMSLGQASVRAVELPTEVEARLLALMRRLRLVYGAVDFRQTTSGEYVFLEVNTAGEFLFIEERTGQPITRAVADWLTRPGEP